MKFTEKAFFSDSSPWTHTSTLSEHQPDVHLHVLVAEICRLRPAVAVEDGEVQDAVGQLGGLPAVLVLLAQAYQGGGAHIGQAHLGNRLPVSDAGRKQDGLIDAVVPDAKGIPGGRPAASVRVKPRVAGQYRSRSMEGAPCFLQGRNSAVGLQPHSGPHGPNQAHESYCRHHSTRVKQVGGFLDCDSKYEFSKMLSMDGKEKAEACKGIDKSLGVG